MASNQLVRGRVKAVPSGDTLVIMTMRNSPSELHPERTITLSSIKAPILARKGGKQSTDEPFAWESREFLRKLCIGKEVSFQVDYTLPPKEVEGEVQTRKGKEFGSVFLRNRNIAGLVVEQGWAKVIERNKGERSPHLKTLRRLESDAVEKGVGRWGTVPIVRDLPPSAVDEPNYWHAMDFLDENRGRSMEAIVEYVRDGSTLHVYLLPDYLHVRVFVAGVQAPLIKNWKPENTEGNGKTSNGTPDTFWRESKQFTELYVLHRDVCIVLEDVDKSGHLIGSVHYRDGEQTKDLALQLVQKGLAKYVDWRAYMLDDDVKQQLQQLELAAKNSRFRMWTNYMPPPTTRAIENQNYTGKVVEVVSGDCIVVADNSSARRRVHRVYLSSIRCPRLVNDKGEAAPYAREAKEFMRKHLIGRQVFVEEEYSWKAAERLMYFGSIFVKSQSRNAEDAGNQDDMTNIAEMMVACGFAEVIRHRDSEARSNHYDALLAAEFRARTAREGIHSGEDAPVITDFLTGPKDEEARHFLRNIQHRRRINAVVEYIFSGHHYKLYIPEQKCDIAFSLSWVRCHGRDGLYYSEAIAKAKTMIMQRDVEIEVEDVDESGTFFGSLWESDSNVAVTLLEHGLAWLKISPNADGITDLHKLEHAEQSAKRHNLKIWKNYVNRQDVSNGQAIKRNPKEKQIRKNNVEGQEVSNGEDIKRKPKQELQVLAKEVLGGGKFYVQLVKDQKAASKIQQQLASLKPHEAPVIGSHKYNKGDLVIAQFSEDNSWNRAMIVNVPQGAIRSVKAKFEVFYIDYGTQEVVAYSRLRPIDCYSVPSLPGLAQLCSLAHVKVPSWEEDYGKEASCYLSNHILHGGKTFKAIIEERDTSGGEFRGHGTGTILSVTLIDTEANISINAVMLKKGLARLDTKRREDGEEKQTIDHELEEYQEEARKNRVGMWENGDIITNDDEN